MHTDVPEFRGANRKRYPQWLIVVMHHSGLFDRWRMPIATGVAYFGELPRRRVRLLPRRSRGPAPRAPGEAQHRRDPRHRHACSTASTASRRRCPFRRCARAPRSASCRRTAPGSSRRGRRAPRPLRLRRAALLRVVEGVLLRGRARAPARRSPRGRPRARLHPRAPRGGPSRARPPLRPAPPGQGLRAAPDRRVRALPGAAGRRPDAPAGPRTHGAGAASASSRSRASMRRRSAPSKRASRRRDSSSV